MNVFRTHKADVYRFTRVGDADSYGATAVYTGLDCQITPAGAELVALYGGNLSHQLYEVYFTEDVTLQVGDKLTAAGKDYIVREAPERFDTPFLAHTRVLAEGVAA